MKRFAIIAAVVVVALVVVPTAFGGKAPVALDGFTPVTTCEACHGSVPASDWAATAHAAVANNTIQSDRAGCAGCHSGNFDPAQAISWDHNPALPGPDGILGTADDIPNPNYGLGDNPTEALVGCSTCHYNGVQTHVGSAVFTANADPLAYGQFANPDVCGHCHDQRSSSVNQYPVYPAMTLTTLRFWPGDPAQPTVYNFFTQPLTDVINIGAGAPGVSGLTMWPGTSYSENVHDTGAVQYDEMYLTSQSQAPTGPELPITHFNSWAVLNAMVPGDTGATANRKINLCAHCMSADQRILTSFVGPFNGQPEPKLVVNPDPTQPAHDSNGNEVTIDQIKYGDTCVACHDPHKRGVSNSVWDGEMEGTGAERNGQLIMPRQGLCGSCHNGELEEGQTAFAPGAHIVHPTQEFMDGFGAIDVPKMPALHKGLCVQCHMVPTAIGSDGSPSEAANHVFTPVMPDTAMNTTDTFSISSSANIAGRNGATESGNTVTITTSSPLNWTAAAVGLNVTISGVGVAGYNGTFAIVSVASPTSFTYTNPTSGLAASGGGVVSFSSIPTTEHMPYSACSTCHEGTNGDNPAKTEAMQQIIDQRQEWTHAMVDEVTATLNAKAVQMGFADAAAAVADADVANSDFGKAWTNMELVSQEGSWGVHNWQYGVAVINKAMEQADAFRVPVAGVTITPNPASLTYGKTLTLTGTVTIPTGGPALMAGDEVRLYINGTPGSFATLSGANYSFTGIQPNKNTTYKILFVGDANYAPTFGDSAIVNVTYRVTLSASKRSVTAGAKVTLNGTVGPTAGPVTIQRQVKGVWKTFKSGVGVNSRSRFDFTFTTKKGTYKLRAVKAAGATVMQGMSGVVTVTAK